MVMAISLEETSISNAKHMSSSTHSCPCPQCGTEVAFDNSAGDSLRRVRELEAQVEMLKEKATAAVDKCADYEDQLRSMKATHGGLLRTNTSESVDVGRPSTDELRPSTANSTSANKSRFSFLTGRRGSPAQSHSMPPPPMYAPGASPPDAELREQLDKERALRAQAEEKARKVDLEIEELSVQLFSQANEMVATERKARAKLEARVAHLEQKDKEKVARLERLENAVTRIDRVKAMLAAPPAHQRKP